MYVIYPTVYPKCDSMRLLDLSLSLIGLRFLSPDWLILLNPLAVCGGGSCEGQHKVRFSTG